MAHNINFNESTGQHSFFSVKEKPWWNLGKVIQEHPNSVEAIKHAGLGYEVVKSPLYTPIDNLGISENGLVCTEQNIEVPNFYATVRNDNNAVLGVVGKDYQIVQNTDAFTFFDSIVGGGDGILYETAGALGKGERIFITAKLPEYIKVGRDDLIEQYIFLTTSHDGTGSITAAFTPIRIVCQNTLNAALKNSSNVVRIRHTANAKQRLNEAHRVMGIATHNGRTMQEVFNHWSKIEIKDREVMKLIQMAMAPNKEILKDLNLGKEDELSTMFKNTCDDVFAYAMQNESQLLETTKGTVFGAYNAITGYFQNVRNYKTDEAKVKSLLMGGTAQLRTQSAFNLCIDFAKDGANILQYN